ncbi:MAG TPA: hypothetical protein VF533_24070 [Solirubrobacteraceae bacterium]|jgi:hypothetical protein
MWWTGGTVRVAIRPPGGVFGAPQVLAAGLDDPAPSIDLVTDRAGEATAVWDGEDGVTAAVRPSGAASFGAPEVVGPGGAAQLAVGDAGVVGAAWLDGHEVRVARRRPGQDFGAVKTVGAGLEHWFPRIELDGHADGSLALLIEGSDDAGTPSYSLATAPPGGAFRAPVAIDGAMSGDTARPASPGWASVGAVPGGRAVVAVEAMEWTREGEGSRTGRSVGLQLQQVGADGLARPPVRAQGVSYANSPRVGADRTGTAVAVFDSMPGTSAVSVPLDGAPCPAERIADHRSIPWRPTLDAGELGVIAWQEIPSSNVHLAFHRPRVGCAPPAEVAQEPRSEPDPPADVSSPPPGADASTAPAAVPEATFGPPAATAAAVGLPSVGVSARVGRRRRTARLRLSCPGPAGCSGRLELRTTGGRRLGARDFSVPAEGARTIRIRLTALARRRMRRGAVRATAILVAGRDRVPLRRLTLGR